MKKTAYYSDLLFTFFLVGLACLCVFRYLRLSFWLSVLLSALCGGLTACSMGAWLHSKRKNVFLKKSEEREKEKLLLHLALLSDHEKTALFQAALSGDEPAVRFGSLRLFTKTECYFLHCTLGPVTADDVAKYSRLKTNKQKNLLCSGITADAAALCQRLQIRLQTADEIYTLIKNKNLLPNVYLGDTQSERPKRRKLWFSKNNAKRFLVGGGLLILSSFLTPFAFYYLLFATALLATAAFVRFFGYE